MEYLPSAMTERAFVLQCRELLSINLSKARNSLCTIHLVAVLALHKKQLAIIA